MVFERRPEPFFASGVDSFAHNANPVNFHHRFSAAKGCAHNRFARLDCFPSQPFAEQLQVRRRGTAAAADVFDADIGESGGAGCKGFRIQIEQTGFDIRQTGIWFHQQREVCPGGKLLNQRQNLLWSKRAVDAERVNAQPSERQGGAGRRNTGEGTPVGFE